MERHREVGHSARSTVEADLNYMTQSFIRGVVRAAPLTVGTYSALCAGASAQSDLF